MKKKQKQRSQSHDTTDSSDANTSSGCLHFHVYVFIFVFGADMHLQWNVIISNVLHSTHFPHTFSVQWHNDTTAFQYIFVAFFWFRAKKNSFIVTMTFCQQHDLKVFSHLLTDNEMVLFNKSILCLWYNHMWWIECIYLQTKEKQMITK